MSPPVIAMGLCFDTLSANGSQLLKKKTIYIWKWLIFFKLALLIFLTKNLEKCVLFEKSVYKNPDKICQDFFFRNCQDFFRKITL